MIPADFFNALTSCVPFLEQEGRPLREQNKKTIPKYISIGWDRCPSTDKPHCHLVISLDGRVNFKTMYMALVNGYFRPSEFHLEPARDVKASINYVKAK